MNVFLHAPTTMFYDNVFTVYLTTGIYFIMMLSHTGNSYNWSIVHDFLPKLAQKLTPMILLHHLKKLTLSSQKNINSSNSDTFNKVMAVQRSLH